MIGQLGFSLVAPPVVLGFAGFWLSNRFDIGSWISWLFIAIGIMTSVSTAAGYYNDSKKKSEKDAVDNPRPKGFNDHL